MPGFRSIAVVASCRMLPPWHAQLLSCSGLSMNHCSRSALLPSPTGRRPSQNLPHLQLECTVKPRKHVAAAILYKKAAPIGAGLWISSSLEPPPQDFLQSACPHFCSLRLPTMPPFLVDSHHNALATEHILESAFHSLDTTCPRIDG